ncbi:hypothetical protein [Moritella sp. F3]|uniref:hypothetical protein n=1 Tax=Moritella sp. F3 TaxID=2718882 RepID=UPI0018E0EC6B|nr:hypothetical protein [Moritella sp. F3]GIC77134.1 hypothetical protein FMO001_18610 [Moritella sp. F1]GIC82253.1 hypothetical protein FMO003_25340 [Moritella sp. F3]
MNKIAMFKGIVGRMSGSLEWFIFDGKSKQTSRQKNGCNHVDDEFLASAEAARLIMERDNSSLVVVGYGLLTVVTANEAKLNKLDVYELELCHKNQDEPCWVTK